MEVGRLAIRLRTAPVLTTSAHCCDPTGSVEDMRQYTSLGKTQVRRELLKVTEVIRSLWDSHGEFYHDSMWTTTACVPESAGREHLAMLCSFCIQTNPTITIVTFIFTPVSPPSPNALRMLKSIPTPRPVRPFRRPLLNATPRRSARLGAPQARGAA